jgi:hypothetical protein
MFEYQTRAIVLSAPIQFKEQEDDRQYLWMEVMQTMLEESLKLPIPLGATSKTLQCIRETLRKVNFLSEFQKEGTSSQLFYALQLVCVFRRIMGWKFTDLIFIVSNFVRPRPSHHRALSSNRLRHQASLLI